MPKTDFDLDERLKRYWLGSQEEEPASQIVQLGVSHRPAAAKQARRALQVMNDLEPNVPHGLQWLIEDLRECVSGLGERLAQLDAIGNTPTEPTAAFFEVLAEAS